MAIPYFIERVAETGSTQADALARVDAGTAVHGLVLTAARQTAGRGRGGHVWQSLEGNLFATLVLFPRRAVAEWGALSLVAALAAFTALRPTLPAAAVLQVKWPNDLLLNNKKVSGILVEVNSSNAEKPAAVIGIGINCQHHPAAGSTPYPTSDLKEAGGALHHPPAVLDAFLASFNVFYTRWEQEGFTTLAWQWQKIAKGVGEEVQLWLSESKAVSGIFNGITTDGALLLEMQAGVQRKFFNGNVKFNAEGLKAHGG